MADPKCAVHEERLQTIESRLVRMEEDLDSIVAENHRNATAMALAEQSFSLFRDIVSRLEQRIEKLEQRIDAMLKDRWQVLAGLAANGAIGATLIGLVLWMMEHKP